MPKGVEHDVKRYDPYKVNGVVEPQMPKGVEHPLIANEVTTPLCGRTSDAERR